MRLLIVTLLLGLGLVSPINAHVLKTNGTIGAVIHIDPEDNPIVGQAATFYLSFKDTAERFQLANCTCQARILRNGQPIATETISSGLKPNEGTFQFTFPERAVYQVEVAGTPNDRGAFDAFTFRYDLRVERTAQPSSGDDTLFHTIHYSVIIAAMLIAGAVAWWQARKKKRITS